MSTSYETKTLEHLGLVAGMFDELGVGELIDTVIPQDFEQRQVTVGQAVKAMVLNGLGFANRRLYLTPHFFANKPTEGIVTLILSNAAEYSLIAQSAAPFYAGAASLCRCR